MSNNDATDTEAIIDILTRLKNKEITNVERLQALYK